MYEDDPCDLDYPPTPLPESPPDHHEYNFSRIHVQFPYEAYPSQRKMMEAMIDSMSTGTNALLESPTGTGKTAALLCASLAWQKKKMAAITKNTINRTRSPLKPHNSTATPGGAPITEKIPLIIYASRTHSQLKQVVGQLKKTAYADTDMVVLASRKHFCINQVAIHSPSVDDTCDKMCANFPTEAEAGDLKELPSPPSKKTRLSLPDVGSSPGSSRSNIRSDESIPPCRFYNDYKTAPAQTLSGLHADEFTSSRSEASWDIEELTSFGKSKGSCPYYISKKLLTSAKLILCNYNHLLHPWIRHALNLDVAENIVIFDEAHNIESTCTHIASKVICLEALTNKQDGILFKLDEEIDKPDVPIEPIMALEILKSVFTNLRKWIDDNKDLGEQISRKNNRKVFVQNIKDPLNEFGIVGFSYAEIIELRDCLKDLSKTHHYEVYDEKGKNVAHTYKCDPALVRSMNSLIFPFQTLFWKEGDDYTNISNYSVDLIKEMVSISEYELKLQITCLNPNVLFKDMKKAHSIIVTSGTLTPIDSFTSELGIEFKHKLSAPHVIKSNQLWAGIITEYRDNEAEEPLDLIFTHDNLNNVNDPKFHQHAHALGQLLLRISSIVPHGLLVFAPSKSLLQRLREYWEEYENDFLNELKTLKELFFENDIKTSSLQDEIRRFREFAEESPKGAMLFAVLRGSVSEGVDFADNHARAVVTIGIPYLPKNDIAVMRKQSFNDRMKDKNFINGKEWYDIQAYRALNQALGRCIRHKKDWGAIFMIDYRCASSKKISKWVQKQVKGREGPLVYFEQELKEFVRLNEATKL